MLRTLEGAGLFIAFALAAWGYGFSLIRFFKMKDVNQPETHLLSCALGLGVIGHLTLLLGVIIGLTVVTAIGIILPGVLLAIYHFITAKLIKPVNWQAFIPRRPNWFSVILLIIICINCLFPLAANALIPPITYDELGYHLGIPQIYLQQGRITYIDFIPYSNWPLETEMLFTLSLLFSSEKLAHLLTWGCMLLVCGGLFLYGKRYFNEKVGWLAAAIFSAVPLVSALTGTGMVELPLALFTFLAVITFLDWVRSNRSGELALSALFGGLAASAKLNAAMIPLILGLLLLILSFIRKEHWITILRRFAGYGLLAFLVVSPWYLKSWLQTGNPFFSFLMGVFPTRNWDVTGSINLFGFINSPNLPATPLNFLRAFWLISTQPGVMGPSTYSLGWIFLALLPASLAAVLVRKGFNDPQRGAAGWLLLLSTLLYTNWFFQTQQSRFLLPALPILALTAAAGAGWLSSLFSNQWQVFPQILVAGAIVFNSWAFSPALRQKVATNWPYLSGQVSREAFLETQDPGYATFAYANNYLPANADVWMALYEDRGYLLDRHYLWANPIGQRVLPLEQYTTSEQLAAALKALGITHIIYNSQRTDRYSYLPNGLHNASLVKSLLADHARLLFSSAEIGLYALTP
jgi:hypothetical protein